MSGSFDVPRGRGGMRLLPILIALALIGYFAIHGTQQGPDHNRAVETFPDRRAPGADGAIFPGDRSPVADSAPTRSEGTEDDRGRVPRRVLEVLNSIQERGRAPDGYEGGRHFLNLGRDGEESLPRRDAQGQTIKYQEWDVHPKIPGRNRGAQRLVTGSDGSAYYTSDHYRTFTKIH